MNNNYENINNEIEKVNALVEKIKLISKRIVIAVVILILLVLIFIDSIIFKQTIKAKDYIDVTATYVEKKEEQEDDIFTDYIYTFEDKKGQKQEIVISISKDSEPKEEVKIKYDENNPQEFYEEGSTFDKSGFIWYIVKIVAVILLVLLFFNKKLLSKLDLSFSVNKN